MKQVVEGVLIISESEGGFGPDLITIDGEELTVAIAAAFGLKLNSRGSVGDDIVLGRVRITIEPMEVTR